jgi:ubiquinol-cytochrome c reductase cytochrome b subunit
MFGSLLILLLLPILDVSRIRGNQFRPLNKLSFWFFVVNFFILMWIGSQHPTEPFVTIGQISTGIYFAWFLIFTPLVGLIENTLFDIGLDSNSTVKSQSQQKNKISSLAEDCSTTLGRAKAASLRAEGKKGEKNKFPI